ncbi:MAG: 30S ribosomal protein S12 methylthiotransferase RimO [Anaerolineae bacterium]
MRFYLLTLGCPKNAVDSEGMSELLRQAGYEATDQASQADLLIVNTCGFIDLAKAESLTALQVFAQEKRPSQYLIAAGCLSQRYGADLVQEVPGIDAIIGTQRWPEIVRLIEALSTRRAETALQLPPSTTRYVASHPVARRADSATAYIKIADGCSAPCAFCSIPQIKGPYMSKPEDAILKEARQLVNQGVKELILIAQDTTAYGSDRGVKDGLPPLIEDILASVPQLQWLRIMYTYPGHLSPRLMEVMAAHPQVCHYIDLPLQHAHPDLLKRMKRPHNMTKVRGLIAELRQVMPDIAIRTTFIVGYPGETEEEFGALLAFLEEMKFDRVGVFTYSEEEGTEAAELPGQLPQEVKDERRLQAMELQQKISKEKNRTFIGRRLEVLVEGVGEGISIGRSYRDAPEVDGMVLIEGELPLNQFAPVHITGALEYDLIASPLA